MCKGRNFVTVNISLFCSRIWKGRWKLWEGEWECVGVGERKPGKRCFGFSPAASCSLLVHFYCSCKHVISVWWINCICWQFVPLDVELLNMWLFGHILWTHAPAELQSALESLLIWAILHGLGMWLLMWVAFMFLLPNSTIWVAGCALELLLQVFDMWLWHFRS